MPMICRGCGCTDDDACIGRDGVPCRWVSENPPICSSCSGDGQMAGAACPSDDRRDAAPVDAGLFSAEMCEASEAPALHAPIFLTEARGYCARCKLGFIT
jgi:hypothetical protein